MLAELDETGLPTQTYYGDGTQIEADVLEHLRDVYRASTRVFARRNGDMLPVDTILTVHGRRSYSGFWRVLLAMARAFSPSDHAIGSGAA